MMKKTGNGYFYWQETEKHTVRLWRCFGNTTEVMIPEKICGMSVTEIAPYCFAQTVHLPQDGVRKTYFVEGEERETDHFAKTDYHELSGKYLESVKLPDFVEKIGNCAFYNCSSLKEISVSNKIEEIGSDAFMNCIQLEKIILRAGVTEKSGLKQILAQISWNIEVTFQKEEKEAVLFYPEYYESYDEIGPAHIFELNLSGEGFRARQCFLDGVVNLPLYDAVFPQACVEESEKVLTRFAWNRLCYPADLKEESKKLYREYIFGHQNTLFLRLILERDLSGLEFLFAEELVEISAAEQAIETAAEEDWPEGVASLLLWKEKYLMKPSKKRYDFEDFCM